jgi:hypothetical protein
MWNSFTFTSYKAPEDSWRCPLPPFIISDYDEKQAKEKQEKKKAEMELNRTINNAMRQKWNEKEEARHALIEKKLAEEEAKSKPKIELEKKKFNHYSFQKKPIKKVREVESKHNDARKAKKNEKKVLDKARAEFFQNSNLLFDDSWIIAIGQALGMNKPQFHIREIKEKLNISSMEKIKIVKPEDEIAKEETNTLSDEQLESLKAEEKKDDEAIQIVRSKATEAIEAVAIAYEVQLKQKSEEAKELEIKKKIEKENIAEIARAQDEMNLMTQADFESKQLDDEDYDLSAILNLKSKQKKLPFEVRFPIWKKVVVETPVIKFGASSIAEQSNIVSATNLRPRKNRLCRSLKIGASPCTNVNCPFLHSLKELKFNPCPFNKKCGRVKLLENGKYKNVGVGCPFHHLNESPNDFFIRDGYLAVPSGYYECPKIEISVAPVITHIVSNMVGAVEVISCIAWKETNLKVLSYPEQKVEEVVVPTRVVEATPKVASQCSTKTRMCDSVSSGNPCRHGEMCRFAHSVDELVISPCQHGENCLFVCNRKGTFYNSNGKFCKFQHPMETRENYFARNGIKTVVAEKKPECKTCTKVCNSVIQGFQCRHKSCNFAHSPEELNIRPCTFPNCKLVRVNSQGKVCNVDCRNRCSFFHEGETKRSFFARIVY